MTDVTVELFKKYNANNRILNYIQKNNINNITFTELLGARDVPFEVLDFCYVYFPLDSEEKELYKEKCGIKNSHHFYYSYSIENSSYVIHSKNVKDSTGVFDSSDIYESEDVFRSMDLKRCGEAWDCITATDCFGIIHSKSLNSCISIINSSHCFWSSNLYNCSNVKDSNTLFNCTDVRLCNLSSFLSKCDNCMCCSGLQGKSQYIFNKEVDTKTFEQYHELFYYLLEEENIDFLKVRVNSYNPKDRFVVTRKLKELYNDFSENFWNKLKTFPNYNEEILAQITFKI